MATTTPSAALVPVAPVFTNTEPLALAGFLAAYCGLTRQAYELDLRQFASWCQQHQLRLFQARRAHREQLGKLVRQAWVQWASERCRPLSHVINFRFISCFQVF